MLKKCLNCKSEKSTEDFHKRSRNLDGLETWCKSCVSIRNKKEYEVKSKRTKYEIPLTKICGGCNFEKGIDEFNKDKAKLDGHVDRCKLCSKNYQAMYRAENVEAKKKNDRLYYLANKESIAQYSRISYVSNKASKRASNIQWKKANRSKVLEYNRWRECSLLQATPEWSDRVEIEKFYAESYRATEVTGVRHVVDHMIPLNNPLVCGLHVPANLRVTDAKSNLEKSNKLDLALLRELGYHVE